METALQSVWGESPEVIRLAMDSAHEASTAPPLALLSACGPVFSRRGYLLFCDSAANRILQWRGDQISVYRQPSNQARALTFDHQGRLIAGENGQVTRIEKDGSVTVLTNASRTQSIRNPVDLVYAIDGNIYFCDGAAVYQIRRDQAVSAVARDCRGPVSVALSANQRILYVGDTGSRTVRAYDLSSSGSLENGRKFIDAASPVGLKTDESGRLWMAEPGGLKVFGGDGAALGSVPLPAPPTGLNWGSGFRDVIVTTAKSVFKLKANTNGTRTY